MQSKLVIVLMLVLILGALFAGLFFLFRDLGRGDRTLKALMLRVALTLALIITLLVSLKMGWIHLHSISP